MQNSFIKTITQDSRVLPYSTPYFYMPEVITPIFSGIPSVFALQKYLNNRVNVVFLDFSVLGNTYCLVAMEGVDLILPSPHIPVFPPHPFLIQGVPSTLIITSINIVYSCTKPVHYRCFLSWKFVLFCFDLIWFQISGQHFPHLSKALWNASQANVPRGQTDTYLTDYESSTLEILSKFGVRPRDLGVGLFVHLWSWNKLGLGTTHPQQNK